MWLGRWDDDWQTCVQDPVAVLGWAELPSLVSSSCQPKEQYSKASKTSLVKSKEGVIWV